MAHNNADAVGAHLANAGALIEALLDGPARIGVLLRGAGADLVRHLRSVGSPPLYILRSKRQRQRRWLAQVDDASYARRMRFSFNGTAVVTR